MGWADNYYGVRQGIPAYSSGHDIIYLFLVLVFLSVGAHFLSAFIQSIFALLAYVCRGFVFEITGIICLVRPGDA